MALAIWLPIRQSADVRAKVHLMVSRETSWESLCGRVYRKSVNVSAAVRFEEIDRLYPCEVCLSKVVHANIKESS